MKNEIINKLKESLKIEEITDFFNFFFINMDYLYDYAVNNKDEKLIDIIDDNSGLESIYFDYSKKKRYEELEKIKLKIKQYIKEIM